MNRLKAAFITNEPQARTVVLLTLLNLFAASQRDGTPWWVWLLAVSLWPIFAFLGNLISPIPTNDGDTESASAGEAGMLRKTGLLLGLIVFLAVFIGSFVAALFGIAAHVPDEVSLFPVVLSLALIWNVGGISLIVWLSSRGGRNG